MFHAFGSKNNIKKTKNQSVFSGLQGTGYVAIDYLSMI
jgi:hypothetical protein